MIEIVMNGPGKNSLGSGMLKFIRARLVEAAGQPVLLTGAGDAFSAGLNLKEVAALDAPAMRVFLRDLEAAMLELYDYPGPTVALVNGHAIAGGCILTLCCDLRVAVDDPRARIGVNEVALGLRFPPGIFEVVRARVPSRSLHDVVLGAGLHDVQSALRLGLIDEVAADARATALRHLARLAAHSPEAYAATKRDLRKSVSEASRRELERFLDEAVPAWTSPAAKERILAVLARR